MARILITGATGSLGRRVAARAVAGGHTVLGTHVRPRRRAPAVTDGKPGGIGAWARLDICDLDAVREVVAAFRPDIVVHTAAGRDRNDWAPTARGAANVALACVALSNGGADSRCREVIPGLAAARWSRGALDAGEAAADSVRGAAVTSGDAVESIVAAAALPGRVRLVHVSSDAIFSGRAGREYTEGDQPDPTYPYGAAKAAAETAVAAIDPSAAIVRTSLILGDGNGAHERLTHDLVAGRVDGALFVDEIRKPVHVDDLADALLEIGAGEYRGVLNVAGTDAVSRYELGLLVAGRDGLDAGRIRSATTSGRPGDIRLDISLAGRMLHTRLRGAHEFMRA